MKESVFKTKLISELKNRFPGCEVILNDSGYIQAIPDLLILFNDKWAMLEVKKSETSSKRPNQEYYVKHYGKMSYAAFICPENKEIILDELEQSFRS